MYGMLTMAVRLKVNESVCLLRKTITKYTLIPSDRGDTDRDSRSSGQLASDLSLLAFLTKSVESALKDKTSMESIPHAYQADASNIIHLLALSFLELSGPAAGRP